jgi:hypothetical protein
LSLNAPRNWVTKIGRKRRVRNRCALSCIVRSSDNGFATARKRRFLALCNERGLA